LPELILTAERLSRSYAPRSLWFDRVLGGGQAGTRPALVDVSLALHRGETVGLVGESGSGKSTLARCISLLERPDTGRVLLDGQDLTAMDRGQLRRFRRRIQVIFQDPFSSLNPRLTVGGAVAEVLRVHKLVPERSVRSRAGELFGQVGLPTAALNRYPSDFSGGQRQRVCIARALAAEPEVLIADEAVSSLDVSIQAQVLNLLIDLRDRLGLTILFISHNLHVVRHVAPRIAVMFGGRIVETLPPGTPLEAARHPYTQALLAASPRLVQDHVGETTGVDDDIGGALPTVGCPFRGRCPRAFDPCESVDPDLLPVAAEHLVACHYAAQAATPHAL